MCTKESKQMFPFLFLSLSLFVFRRQSYTEQPKHWIVQQSHYAVCGCVFAAVMDERATTNRHIHWAEHTRARYGVLCIHKTLEHFRFDFERKPTERTNRTYNLHIMKIGIVAEIILMFANQPQKLAAFSHPPTKEWQWRISRKIKEKKIQNSCVAAYGLANGNCMRRCCAVCVCC